METKVIQLPPPKPITSTKSKDETKTVIKEHIKRQITTTKRWIYSQDDIATHHQQTHLTERTPFLLQQIKNKIHSYRGQDIEKGFVDRDKDKCLENEFLPKTQRDPVIDLSGVLQKLEDSQLHCFYCKETVMILYDNVREPKQWTLERLDNKIGHTYTNVVIACLSCNLRRRTMKFEKYIMTKEIQKVVKKDSSIEEPIISQLSHQTENIHPGRG